MRIHAFRKHHAPSPLLDQISPPSHRAPLFSHFPPLPDRVVIVNLTLLPCFFFSSSLKNLSCPLTSSSVLVYSCQLLTMSKCRGKYLTLERIPFLLTKSSIVLSLSSTLRHSWEDLQVTGELAFALSREDCFRERIRMSQEVLETFKRRKTGLPKFQLPTWWFCSHSWSRRFQLEYQRLSLSLLLLWNSLYPCQSRDYNRRLAWGTDVDLQTVFRGVRWLIRCNSLRIVVAFCCPW